MQTEMIAIPKPGVTEVSAKSDRPMCLINVMGKVLESLMLHHLKGIINQFVGCKGHTTDTINQLLSAFKDSPS